MEARTLQLLFLHFKFQIWRNSRTLRSYEQNKAIPMEHTVLNHALANLPLVRSCQKPDVSRLKRELRGKAKLYSKWISRVDLPPEGIRLLPQFENSETVTLGRFSRKLYQSILAARGAKESPEDDGSGSSEVESELSSDDLSFNSTDSDEDSVSGSSTSEYSSSNEDEVEARNALTQEMQSYFDLGETEDKRAEIARIFLAKQPPSIPPEVRILDKLEDDSVIPAIPGSASQPDPVSKDRGGRMFLNYYGTWERAEMHGNGGYVFADGGVFTGDFIHNKMQGHGEKTQSVGTFQGDFVDNKRHGTGRTKCGHGCVYEGEFVDGERSGVGKLRLPTGVVYEGEFKHGVVSIEALLSLHRNVIAPLRFARHM